MFRPELILKSLKICKKKSSKYDKNSLKSTTMPPKSTMVVIQMVCNIFLECVPFHVGDKSQNRADKRRRRRLLSALYLKKLTYLQDPPYKIDFRIFGLKCVSDNSESISKKNIFWFLKKNMIFPQILKILKKFCLVILAQFSGEPGMELEVLIWFCSN